ncbi:MAG TPA: glycosyltransferase family 4 protein [Bryobacteraceae bacterium]|nr:glycosyltransferase family 4 protein [Bryobacteraceae bacterium]
MRILHVDGGRGMRGGQWQALLLSEALAARGHVVTLLARGPLLEAARARELDARPFSAFGWPPADIVHAHDAHSHTLAVMCGRRPLVVSRRVAFPIKTGLLSRWKYSRVDHYIAVSDCVRRKLLDAGVSPQRTSVVYDGVPERPPARTGSRIVAPATEDPRKGSDLLRRAASLGGFEVVFSADLNQDLEDASAFAYISRDEGLGSAALLAMAAGVPVVASRVGGLAEVVVDGETGVLVENTPESIAAGVAAAAGRRDMGERGRARVLERFSVDAMAEGTLAVYNRVLG